MMKDKTEDFAALEIGSVPTYERPAIVITERVGEIEKTTEFATKEDYKFYKDLED